MDYGNAGREVRKLMIEGGRTDQVFYLDSEANFCSGLKPTLVMTNGDLEYIEINFLNDEFHPANVPSKIFKHVAMMAPTDKVPHFAVAKGATEVPGALLAGMAWGDETLTADSHFTIFALPIYFIGGLGQ